MRRIKGSGEEGLWRKVSEGGKWSGENKAKSTNSNNNKIYCKPNQIESNGSQSLSLHRSDPEIGVFRSSSNGQFQISQLLHPRQGFHASFQLQVSPFLFHYSMDLTTPSLLLLQEFSWLCLVKFSLHCSSYL